MTTTHTPGRLQVPEPHDDQCAVIVKTTGGQYAVAVGIRNPANARRLAACWNVCDGMDTELLEHIVLLGETMHSRFKARDNVEQSIIADRLRFMQERDALLTHLQAVISGWLHGDDIVGPMNAARQYLDNQPQPPNPDPCHNCGGDWRTCNCCPY